MFATIVAVAMSAIVIALLAYITICRKSELYEDENTDKRSIVTRLRRIRSRKHIQCTKTPH